VARRVSGHCHHDHDQQHNDRRILYIVLALNFSMFGLEIWQGLMANSTSLLADSMDFLSDSFSYIITLFVLAKTLSTRAKASLLKAGLMLLLAAVALTQGVHNIYTNETPQFITMGWVGALALAANLISAWLLFSSRNRDSNMRSVWLCSRNDAIANVAIICAAFFVYLTGTLWPDLIVALIIAWLGGSSALKIIAQAKQELRENA
jgi:cation diffusion facilitator family transporter